MTDVRRARVLVIDDDASVREVLRYLLEEFGYECHVAADGVTGLAHLDEGNWDLLLTDLQMPHMSGWQVIDAVRQRAPTLPIVIVTAFADPDVMRRAVELGASLITKPFPMETLKATVATALRRKPADSGSG